MEEIIPDMFQHIDKQNLGYITPVQAVCILNCLQINTEINFIYTVLQLAYPCSNVQQISLQELLHIYYVAKNSKLILNEIIFYSKCVSYKDYLSYDEYESLLKLLIKISGKEIELTQDLCDKYYDVKKCNYDSFIQIINELDINLTELLKLKQNL